MAPRENIPQRVIDAYKSENVAETRSNARTLSLAETKELNFAINGWNIAYGQKGLDVMELLEKYKEERVIRDISEDTRARANGLLARFLLEIIPEHASDTIRYIIKTTRVQTVGVNSGEFQRWIELHNRAAGLLRNKAGEIFRRFWRELGYMPAGVSIKQLEPIFKGTSGVQGVMGNFNYEVLRDKGPRFIRRGGVLVLADSDRNVIIPEMSTELADKNTRVLDDSGSINLVEASLSTPSPAPALSQRRGLPNANNPLDLLMSRCDVAANLSPFDVNLNEGPIEGPREFLNSFWEGKGAIDNDKLLNVAIAELEQSVLRSDAPISRTDLNFLKSFRARPFSRASVDSVNRHIEDKIEDFIERINQHLKDYGLYMELSDGWVILKNIFEKRTEERIKKSVDSKEAEHQEVIDGILREYLAEVAQELIKRHKNSGSLLLYLANNTIANQASVSSIVDRVLHMRDEKTVDGYVKELNEVPGLKNLGITIVLDKHIVRIDFSGCTLKKVLDYFGGTTALLTAERDQAVERLRIAETQQARSESARSTILHGITGSAHEIARKLVTTIFKDEDKEEERELLNLLIGNHSGVVKEAVPSKIFKKEREEGVKETTADAADAEADLDALIDRVNIAIERYNVKILELGSRLYLTPSPQQKLDYRFLLQQAGERRTDANQEKTLRTLVEKLKARLGRPNVECGIAALGAANIQNPEMLRYYIAGAIAADLITRRTIATQGGEQVETFGVSIGRLKMLKEAILKTGIVQRDEDTTPPELRAAKTSLMSFSVKLAAMIATHESSGTGWLTTDEFILLLKLPETLLPRLQFTRNMSGKRGRPARGKTDIENPDGERDEDESLQANDFIPIVEG